jgi:hypothetical protein
MGAGLKQRGARGSASGVNPACLPQERWQQLLAPQEEVALRLHVLCHAARLRPRTNRIFVAFYQPYRYTIQKINYASLPESFSYNFKIFSFCFLLQTRFRTTGNLERVLEQAPGLQVRGRCGEVVKRC